MRRRSILPPFLWTAASLCWCAILLSTTQTVLGASTWNRRHGIDVRKIVSGGGTRRRGGTFLEPEFLVDRRDDGIPSSSSDGGESEGRQRWVLGLRGGGGNEEATEVDTVEAEALNDEGEEEGRDTKVPVHGSIVHGGDDADGGDTATAAADGVTTTTDDGPIDGTAPDEQNPGTDEGKPQTEPSTDTEPPNHPILGDTPPSSTTTTTDQDEPSTKTETPSTTTPKTLRQNASRLRTEGKRLHDQGEFSPAAATFRAAAKELESLLIACDGADKGEGEEWEVEEIAEECATCLLHQALCHLKGKDYVECIQSCTDVLEDTVQIIPLPDTQQVQQEEEKEEEEDVQQQRQQGEVQVQVEEEGEEAEEDADVNKHTNDTSEHKTTTPTTIRITPTTTTTTSTSSPKPPTVQLSAAVRARAFHRRAKARLALGDSSGALDDSRSAAFLGDRNAVALYGRLMREQPTTNTGSGGGGGDVGGGGDLFGSAAGLESLFSGGTTPFGSGGSGDGGGNGILGNGPSSSSSSSPPSTFDILNSFMGSAGAPGGANGDTAAAPTVNPFGDIGSLLSMGMGGKGTGKGGGGGGFDTMAKSLLLSLTSRIEDESTQRTISTYLRGLDVTQLMGLSSMAGMPLNRSSADRIVRIANGFTPGRIRKYVRRTKRVVTVGSTLRKAMKVLSKYKHLLILFVMIYWIKSAILQPVYVGKGAMKKAAKKAIRDSVSTASFFL